MECIFTLLIPEFTIGYQIFEEKTYLFGLHAININIYKYSFFGNSGLNSRDEIKSKVRGQYRREGT